MTETEIQELQAENFKLQYLLKDREIGERELNMLVERNVELGNHINSLKAYRERLEKVIVEKDEAIKTEIFIGELKLRILRVRNRKRKKALKAKLEFLEQEAAL